MMFSGLSCDFEKHAEGSVRARFRLTFENLLIFDIIITDRLCFTKFG